MTINSIKTGLTLLFLGFAICAQAQLQFGFRAGLNSSTISSESELDPVLGTELETFSTSNGFHLGMAFGYELNDFVGFRGEFLYNQKGYAYLFEGPAYQYFTSNSGNKILTNGTKRMAVRNSNAYIDIPVSFYVRPIKKLEFSFGAGIGFLVSSLGNGALEYNDIVGNIADQSWDLNYNYFRDEAGEIIALQEGTININGQFVNQNAATGAYYDYDELDGKFFNTVNINLHGSVCFFLNSSVFLSARYFYGLSDITNDFYSVKKSVLDSDSNPIPNPQDNRSLSTQFSLGFYF